MRRLLSLLGRGLVDHREFIVLLVLASFNCALVSLPLVGLPGYEFSAALALVYGVVGTVLTACAPHRPPLQAVARHTAWLVASMLPALGLSMVRATPCSPFAALGFFPLLPVISAFVASSAGAFVASRTTRWWSAMLSALSLLLLSAISTGWPILMGPQVFAFNHFGGYFPGPLYDETLRITPALLWFRFTSLALGALFTGLAMRRSLLWALAAAAFLALELSGTSLGFRMNDEVLAQHLGGVRETEHFVLHYPQSKPKGDTERFLTELEFRHAQISAFLGGAPAGRVTVWLYRTADEKQRWVGAQHTQFSKPWRREVHVNEAPFPHPVIKHELVHAMAAPLGRWPFGVTATRFGLSPYIGIVEGLAVAGDNPVDELTLHEWAAAMTRQQLLPDVRVLLRPAGFYSAPASRAYTSAGSFLRWLGETWGGQKLRALYHEGDFAGIYGRPLAELVTDWEHFLQTVPLNEAAVNLAFARFKQGSLFDRACAREVASVSAEANALLRDDPLAALVAFERCHDLQPNEPSHELAQAEALRRLGRLDEAAARLEALAERVKEVPTPWSEAALALADIALLRGDLVTAQALLQRIVALQVSPSVERTATVRLASLALPRSGLDAVRRYFAPGSDESRSYFLLRALEETPREPTLAYLLGRRLAQSDAPAEALNYFEQVLAASTPESLRREALRLAIEMAWHAGRCDRVRALAADARVLGNAFAVRAQEWVARCDFK